MSVRLFATLLIAHGLLGAPALAETAESEPSCSTQRHWLSERLQEARLQGDQARQAQLNDQMQALSQRCQGLVALGARHTNVIELASRRVERRETLLREALASGDAQLIELRKDELARAREQLEASRRPPARRQ